MLRELLIKNFAIIDDLNIRFDDGLTILSGETGAGKSIIINAVNLLLGSRASSKMIRDGHDSAELSAFFDVPKGSYAATIMDQNGYDPDEGLLVRRVIAANDRHRIFVNDRMATMQMLSAVTSGLASISSQHAHQGLLKENSHLTILDQFGGLLPIVRKVSDLYEELVPMLRTLEALIEKKENQDKEKALFQYQLDEISDADIFPGEDEQLEKDRLRLKNAQSLQWSIQTAIETLLHADGAIVEKLGEVRKSLEKASQLDDVLIPAVDSLSDHLYGLEDVTQILQARLNSMDMEADRLDLVETRLDLINRLKRKYGGSLDTLFQARDEIDAQLQAIDHLDDDIQQRQAQLKDCFEQIADLARRLSKKRRRVASDFARAVEKELGNLRMAGTHFEVQFSPLPCGPSDANWLCVDGSQLSATGIDQAVFMIAPNVGESLKPLSATASGGELSRVVLALKAILAATDMVGTVIFDEVDAGIGGAVADVVGKKLTALSKKHQLICITHLPQIARYGDHHYHIQKQVKKGRTITTIRPMDTEDRIKEIARMLGGEQITPTALEHARNLIDIRSRAADT